MKFLLENEQREKKELQQALQVTTNKGRAYHEVVFVYSIPTTPTNGVSYKVGERQKRRKVSDIKMLMSSTIETCVTSHGLKPAMLTAETSDGKLLNNPFSDQPATITEPADRRANVLFLLDRFAVSDEFFHELAQVSRLQSTLPQSMSSDTDISRDPTSLPRQRAATLYEQQDRHPQPPFSLCREVHGC